MSYLMVATTCDTPACATAITEALLAGKLAACIQQGATNSHYRWKGDICHAEEITLTIKTRASLWPQVENTIRQHHTYETPEIVAWPITHGHAPYLQWMEEATQ